MVLDTTAVTPTSTIFSTSSSSNVSLDEDDEDDAATSVAKQSTPSDDLLLSPSHLPPKNKVGKRLHISHLLQMVLQDAQTRLFFKAQAVIQAEIRHYAPKAEELAWPDILVCKSRSCSMVFSVLVAAEKTRTGNEIREKESMSQIFTGVTALQNKDTWYPTLRTTVWVLSQLHDFVKVRSIQFLPQPSTISFAHALPSPPYSKISPKRR
jgi:hypothetical protein